MGPNRIVTALLAASVCAVGLAGPAFATDEITQNAVGTYEFEGKSVGTRTWNAVPCDGDTPRCIRVTEFGAGDGEAGNPRWSGNAYWQVGSWIMFVEVPNAVECKDGTEHNIRVNYSWDAVENTGWRSFNDAGICGGDAKSVATPFTLAKIGPPPPPLHLPLPGDYALPPMATEAPLLPPAAAGAPLRPAAAEAPLPPAAGAVPPPPPPAAAE